MKRVARQRVVNTGLKRWAGQRCSLRLKVDLVRIAENESTIRKAWFQSQGIHPSDLKQVGPE